MKLLFESILTEGKNLEQTVNTWTEKIKTKFGQTEEDAKSKVISLIELDPTYTAGSTTTGDYGEWILKNYYKMNFIDGGFETKILELLNDFIDKKANLEDKDINHYTPQVLKGILDKVELTPRQLERRLRNSKEIEFLFKGKNWSLYKPLSYAGSCTLGKGTRWCTAYSEDSQWYRKYHAQGDLFVFINNDNPNIKYQYHIPTQQFLMADDKTNVNPLGFFLKNLDILQFFLNYFADSYNSNVQIVAENCNNNELWFHLVDNVYNGIAILQWLLFADTYVNSKATNCSDMYLVVYALQSEVYMLCFDFTNASIYYNNNPNWKIRRIVDNIEKKFSNISEDSRRALSNALFFKSERATNENTIRGVKEIMNKWNVSLVEILTEDELELLGWYYTPNNTDMYKISIDNFKNIAEGEMLLEILYGELNTYEVKDVNDF